MKEIQFILFQAAVLCFLLFTIDRPAYGKLSTFYVFDASTEILITSNTNGWIFKYHNVINQSIQQLGLADLYLCNVGHN